MSDPMVPRTILHWIDEAVASVYAGKSKRLELASWGWVAMVYIYQVNDKAKTDIVRVDLVPPKAPEAG